MNLMDMLQIVRPLKLYNIRNRDYCSIGQDKRVIGGCQLFYSSTDFNNSPARFALIRHKVSDPNFRMLLNVICQFAQSGIEFPLFLLVQFRPGFCQPGRFRDCIIVTNQRCEGSKLCRPVGH